MENDLIPDLLSIFPDFDIEIIEDVIKECGGDSAQAIEILFAMQSGEDVNVGKKQEVVPDEILEKIKEIEIAEKKEKLKECAKFDKEMQKVLSASAKDFKKEQKKNEKNIKEAKKQKSVKADEDFITMEPLNSSEKDTKIHVEVREEKKDIGKNKPVEVNAGNGKNSEKKLGFGDKLKNLFKKKPKPAPKDENLYIEMPDFSNEPRPEIHDYEGKKDYTN